MSAGLLGLESRYDGGSYLSDVLVPYFADLLDVCRALRNALQRVSADDQLVLLRLGDLDVDARLHHHPLHDLLADEISAEMSGSALCPAEKSMPRIPIALAPAFLVPLFLHA
jgi:hypothetical protein